MSMYLKSYKKESCCGCRACEQVCKRACIKMNADEEGFLYPDIDNDKCINCGMCKKVCPIDKDTTSGLNFEEPFVYAAWHKDNEILKESSSGGVFTALAQYILDRNGVVFGCSLDEDMVAKHVRIDSKDDLYKLRGSKYVQSDTNDTFAQVKQLIKEGKYILYTGTPCQIAGLKSFIGPNSENLITVDLICHGVPSPKIFDYYIKHLSKKHNGKIMDFSFRDKSKYGWGEYGFRYKISKNNKIYKRDVAGNLSPYGYAFFRNYLQRPVCYKCQYTTTKREGDITLADFWGVDRIHPEIDPNNGISLVIVNTEKGKKVFGDLDEKINKVSSTLENAKLQNNHLENSSDKPEARDYIYKEIDKLGFEEAAKRYFRPKNIILVKIKSMIPTKLKRKIKRYI